MIHRTSDCDNIIKKVDCANTISQVACLQSGKFFFAGVGELERPGSVQVYRMDLQKQNEVQAHSGPITRMRLSFDNQKLFTVATDGNLYIYDIKDRDTKGPAVKREFPGIETFSQEILVDKSELEDFKNTKDTLQNEISSA